MVKIGPASLPALTIQPANTVHVIQRIACQAAVRVACKVEFGHSSDEAVKVGLLERAYWSWDCSETGPKVCLIMAHNIIVNSDFPAALVVKEA
jgi:hypothetical protein